jgi:hypothetical protein
MNHITSRTVLHFPGFEPLNGEKHRERFERNAAQTSILYNISIICGELTSLEGGSCFDVQAFSNEHQTKTNYYICDLSDPIKQLQSRPLWQVLISGYIAFAKTIYYGGTQRYLKHAWRFGLFSIFPFVYMTVLLSLSVALVTLPLIIGYSPWLMLGTLPLAAMQFYKILIPFSNKLHTLLLFSNWKCAVDFATLKNEPLNARMTKMRAIAKIALQQKSDEYVLIAHSIGGHTMVHVIGQLLEEEPELFKDKNIIIASIGSAILQGALMRPADVLRKRVCDLAAHKNIFWFEVQCLTDISNFYKTKVAALCGYVGNKHPSITYIRIKTMLTNERYKRIKRDLLRVHRQYVLANDKQSNYDFALMCSSSIPVSTFAHLKVGEIPKFISS